MRCPNCGNLVTEHDQVCPNCGNDLTVFRSFSMLKTELDHVQTEAFAVLKRVDLLQQRFTQFEELFSKVTIQPVLEERPRETSSPEVTFSEADFPGEPVAESAPVPSPITLQEVASKPGEAVPPKPSARFQHSEIAVGQKWLLIAGVIATVLGVGWFLKYSFDQNWIGPAGRVASAYLGGIAFLTGGELFRRKRYHIFGLYLIGGGLAMLYFATFAAFQIYHLLPHVLAFTVMVLITSLAGGLALAYDTKWLAVLGLIGGFMTPVVLSLGQDHQMALMTYMTILNGGILSIAFFKQWRLLNYLGFFLTWLLFSGWFFDQYSREKFWLTVLFLNIFFLTYAFVPFVYHLVKGHRKRLSGIRILIPNSFIALGYSFAIIDDRFRLEYVSIATLSYAVIFLWMAQMLYQRNREQVGAFVMLLAEAMIFLVLTVPIVFSKQWITMFWGIQAVVLLWAALKLRNKWLYGSFWLLLGMTLVKFFWIDYEMVFRLNVHQLAFRRGYTFLLPERYLISLMILLALVIAALMVSKAESKFLLLRGREAPVLWGGFVIALFVILNVEVDAFFFDYAKQARFAAISVLWTFFSVAVMIVGFVRNLSLLRKSALGLFAVTMAKVLFLDMAHVSTPYRVISFLVLGVMLIGASYLYHRFRDRILPSDSAGTSAHPPE